MLLKVEYDSLLVITHTNRGEGFIYFCQINQGKKKQKTKSKYEVYLNNKLKGLFFLK